MSNNNNLPVRQFKPNRPARRNQLKQRNNSVPIARSRQRKASGNMRVKYDASQTIVLSGTDTFQLADDDNTGFHMTCNVLANPLYWYGTRISGIAKVYQKYKPRFLRFRYAPSCPATSTGSISMGVLEADRKSIV